ncbi:MAG: response regulator [Cytophagales bacterium]|nr:response regulator [Cytophagales bacterium]
MFVDDEPINLLLFEKRFEEDFKILTASSGMETLEKLEIHAQELEVIISDMRMPSMSGLEFIKTARKRFTGIRYFILTGYSYDKELENALQDQVIERLLKKPYDYETIKDAVVRYDNPKISISNKTDANI